MMRAAGNSREWRREAGVEVVGGSPAQCRARCARAWQAPPPNEHLGPSTDSRAGQPLLPCPCTPTGLGHWGTHPEAAESSSTSTRWSSSRLTSSTYRMPRLALASSPGSNALTPGGAGGTQARGRMAWGIARGRGGELGCAGSPACQPLSTCSGLTACTLAPLLQPPIEGEGGVMEVVCVCGGGDALHPGVRSRPTSCARSPTSLTL